MPRPGTYGCKPNDPSRPRLYLDDYFTAAAAELPAFARAVDDSAADYPMYMNGPDDQAIPPVPREGIANCTAAYMGHAVQSLTAAMARQGLRDPGGSPVTELTPSYADVLAAYGAYGGYVPGKESTDQGAELQVMLGWWARHPFAGVQLAAFGQLRKRDAVTLNIALQLGGTVCLGVNLPGSAEDQFGQGQPWEPVRGSQVAGGHCVGVQAFEPGKDLIRVTTWGALWPMSKAFDTEYTEEAWLPVLPQALARAAAAGAINTRNLAADFKLMTGRTLRIPPAVPAS